MIAVIFEVWPHPEYRGPYLDLAAELRPHLAGIDGFISVERFESLTEPGKLLSLSIWRDEAALRTGAGSASTGQPRRWAAAGCSRTTACA